MTHTNAKNTATLEIDSLSYGPYGIGRLDGKAIMIPHTAPGDKVEVRVVEAKERYAVGEAIRVLTSSLLRQTPPCPYVGTCGGCSWQHLHYDAQLNAKQKSVEDALRRIGKLDNFEMSPIIPSAAEYGYRRRIRLQVGPNKMLGFFGAGSHRLVEIGSCLIAVHRLNGVIDALRRWLPGLETTMEYVEIVSGDDTDEIVVVAQAIADFVARDEMACAGLVGGEATIQGLIAVGRDWRKAWGRPAITVKLIDDISLTVDGDVFTQVNPDGNRRILRELLAAGDFQIGDRVLELYSGAGNFTLPIAARVREITAVEGHRAAVTCGKLSSQKNGLDNIRWSCSPVPQAVARLKERRDKFTKIVLDPPRAGAKGIEDSLASLGAAKIFYVSCNPTTMARDLAALTEHGYKLRMVQPIDLFPQTFHVETLAVVEL